MKYQNNLYNIRTRLLLILSWVPVGYTVLKHGVSPYQITGSSMAPSLNPGLDLVENDVVLVKKYGLKGKDGLARGDIVVFRSPYYPDKLSVKRVVGIQGDKINTRPPCPKPQQRVLRNHVWVEGDNAFHSIDSNTFGPISQGLVVGKVIAVIWPLSRIGVDFSKGGRDPRDLDEPV